MTASTAPRPRPEFAIGAGCACGQPRCAMTGPCLDVALADDRYGIWVRDRRRNLRLAS